MRPGFVVCLRNRWRDLYSDRWLLLFPYLLPGARGCLRLLPLASRIVRDDLTPLIGCVSLCSILDSLLLSKSDHGVITWSPSGYTLDCPDTLPSPCLLITMWQLVKAHGVTRNEPKIHVICYNTVLITTLSSGLFIHEFIMNSNDHLHIEYQRLCKKYITW